MGVVAVLTACASVTPVDQSVKQERYRLHKQYDLLEKSLKEDLSTYESRGSLLGQLYAALDLAELYTYGLINFHEAFAHLQKAATLNERLHLLPESADGTKLWYEGQYILSL